MVMLHAQLCEPFAELQPTLTFDRSTFVSLW